MATQLDLQEQEQLDALKAFWKQQGNLITWLLVLVLGAFAAWNGWQYWQGEKAAQAATMFEQIDRAAVAGDTTLAEHIFADLRERFPKTAFAEQAALTLAKLQVGKGRLDDARATLNWLAEHGVEEAMQTVARLRLAALQADAHQDAEALKTLEGATAPSFAALVDDRRGDALLALGRKTEALADYRAAYQAMSDQLPYRRLIEAKLMALGAAPPASAASASASGVGR